MDDGQRSCDVVAKTKKAPKETVTKTKERSIQTTKIKEQKAGVDAASGSASKSEKIGEKRVKRSKEIEQLFEEKSKPQKRVKKDTNAEASPTKKQRS